jgi:Asp-tRNA(Asn)/Glu-tRNA(Gln) amidotransferase A subunit family amidase
MALDRRNFFLACSKAGAGATLLPGVLYALVAKADSTESTANTAAPITEAMIDEAAKIAGVGPFTAAQKKQMLAVLKTQRAAYDPIRELNLPNSVPPAYVFHPLPAKSATNHASPCEELPKPGAAAAVLADHSDSDAEMEIPANLEKVCYWSAARLSQAIRAGKISSLDLTRMYIARLKRLDARLHCVITLTEERALRQAREADASIRRGEYKGPLHGIPWGAKDLLAVKGCATTWGAGGFEKQSFDADATVVNRLDAAGAVLIAKLSLGALAMGDKWFGGRTRNPWNLDQGSSGSSAGSAAAVAAGCAGFAIGSETLGSISSPSTRCGTTGLRPTFGLVPRTGAMALSWTMDKLGPIARSVEDCNLILSIIAGPDGKDISVARDFHEPQPVDVKKLRIGFHASAFDDPPPAREEAPSSGESAEEKQAREAANRAAREARERRIYDLRFERAALGKLRAMGYELHPVELPDLPYDAMAPLLTAEAAAAFDSLTRSGRDALLTGQNDDDWPNLFRAMRFYPAIEYIQANRARTLLVEQMRALFEKVDILVTSSYNNTQLTASNLSGHPALIVPNGLRGSDAPRAARFDDGNSDDIGGPGTPVSITFLAAHYQDAALAAFGRAYQEATGFHKLHPPVD